MMRTGFIHILMIVLLSGLLAACGGGTPSGGSGGTASVATWLVAEMPARARNVAEVKKDAREGDHVVVRGRIGGRRDPMSRDTALFLMMDPAVPSCSDRPGDTCPAPWDYCCETPESKAANNATVRIVDATGTALALDVSRHGFEPLAEVIVVGTVGPRDSAAVLIINATAVHLVTG